MQQVCILEWSRRRLPDPLPLYAFTTSAIDGSLAPPGHHTVYLACPSAPASPDARSSWSAAWRWRSLGHPGSSTVSSARVPTRLSRWRGTRRGRLGHPMHLDITLDQIGPLRPTPGLGRHRTPVEGLYVSGAGTSPTGGIAGTPGRMAARALLRDRRRRAT